MRILIDADACPVISETLLLARKYGASCIAFCDSSHLIQKENLETRIVAKGADSADFALVNAVEKGDIVVTQDYGLAAMCLSRNAYPIRQDGLIYTHDNIEGLLQIRYTEGKIRRSGGRTKGHPKRSKMEDMRYAEQLESLLTGLVRSEGRKHAD